MSELKEFQAPVVKDKKEKKLKINRKKLKIRKVIH